MERPLSGRIAVVAGATRGAGRGIACMLGEAGATVYCTGRSVRGQLASGPQRPETIDETAEMVAARGGVGIAVHVDHRDESQVQALFERVRGDCGRLDVLVNDIWGGEKSIHWGKPFWEQPLENVEALWRTAIFTHMITARYGAPIMVEQGHGLILEITDGDSSYYRGNLHYDVVKHTVNRMAFAMAQELRPHGVTALALTPGFLRSEEMLDYFGVSEANWQDGAQKDIHFLQSETPYFVGRAAAALAADPYVFSRTGSVCTSWDLSVEYGFKDIDGRSPHWGSYFETVRESLGM